MATDRVGIYIDLMGYDEAMSQMKSLESAMKGLSGHRNYVKIKAEVEKLKLNKNALKAQKVSIEADTKNIDREITRLQNRIKQINKGKGLFGGNAGQQYAKAAEASINRLKARIKELQSLRLDMNWRMGNIQAEINQTTSAIQRMEAALRQAKGTMASMDLGQIWKGATTRFAHMGAAMQSLGNAINRLMSPMRMLTNGALLGAGYKALGTVTEGLKSGFARYDTMKKYPKMMEQLGYSSKDAEKSINKLNDAVLGLPTGLDEIVSMAQRYTLSMGDMNKGTETAIAVNNAFLASMASEAQRYQGMMQIQDLVNGKKLNSREWDSLITSMSAGINAVGKELGYTDDEMGKFQNDLKSGDVSADKFLKTLRKVGNEGGKLAEMANLSKDTWEAFSANVSNAFSRMGYKIITTLDELTQAATGKNLNQLFTDTIIPGIDKMAESVQAWIRSHPEEITDFVKDLKAIDWKGLGKGFLEGIGFIADQIHSLAEKLKGKDLENVGKFIFGLSMLGPALNITGGIIKGGRHILGGAVAVVIGLGRFVGGLASVMGLAGAASFVGNAVKAIKGLRTASKVGKEAGTMAKIFKRFKTLQKASRIMGGGAKAGAVFKGFLPAIELIGGIGALMTEVSGIAYLNTKLLSASVKNIELITSGIGNVFKNVKGIKGQSFDANGLRGAVNNLFSIYDIIYGETTSQKAVGKTIQTQHKKEGLGSMKGRELKKIADSVSSMDDVFTYMGSLKQTIGKFKGFKGFGKDAISGITDFVSQIGEMYNTLSNSFAKSTTPKSAEGFAKIMDTTKTMFSDIVGLVSIFPKLQTGLFTVMSRGGGTGMGRSQMDMIKEQLAGENGLFASLGKIYDSIENDFLGGAYFKKGNMKDIGSFSEMMGNIKTMFTGINDLLLILPKIQQNIAPMSAQAGSPGSGNTGFSMLKFQITSMMKQIGDIFDAFNQNIPADPGGMVKKFDQVKEAIGKIKGIVKSLNSLGEGGMSGGDTPAFTAIQNIKGMIKQLGTALNTELISQFQADVDAFKTSIDQMFEALNKSCSDIKVEVHIDGKVTGVDGLLSQIRSAKARIQAAVRSIPNSYTRHVYIHVTPHVNVGSVSMPSIPGVNPHTGGYIAGAGELLYRKRGGSVSPFRPKGTDTVPAMLTPGEYVMRRQAVSALGVRFMQRINHLDIAGAMRELSAKVGNSAVGARATNIYNNVTNNNSPTINQNINTNNPNFAYRRSNRYVMGL